jgi:hypothetical protein
VWQRVDLVLRFVYVLLAPLVLMVMASIVSLGAIVVTTAIATIIALAGSARWRRRVTGIPVVGRPLAKFAALGEYYDEHPPKPLLYYIFYPALFPYWLIKRDARREFMVYRRVSAITLLAVVGLGTLDYFRHWQPIPFDYFVGVSIGMFIFQLLATFAIVMPIVTTIITLHQQALKRTLIALVAGALAVAALTVVTLKDHVPMSVLTRTRARTIVQHHEAFEALHKALQAAASSIAAGADDELTLSRVHDALETLYHPDEAAVFRLYHDDRVIVVYAKFGRNPTMWLGMANHHPVNVVEGLTPGARAVLGV